MLVSLTLDTNDETHRALLELAHGLWSPKSATPAVKRVVKRDTAPVVANVTEAPPRTEPPIEDEIKRRRTEPVGPGGRPLTCRCHVRPYGERHNYHSWLKMGYRPTKGVKAAVLAFPIKDDEGKIRIDPKTGKEEWSHMSVFCRHQVVQVN